MEVDWDKGLPPDVLALVATASVRMEGCLHLMDMAAMREVSKSWKEGFELGVKKIEIFDNELQHPVLPSGIEAAERFPGLTALDLGYSATSTAWLGTLGAFSKLHSLSICRGDLFPGSLGDLLADADLAHLQVCNDDKHNPRKDLEAWRDN